MCITQYRDIIFYFIGICIYSIFLYNIFFFLELCGTPGYLSPEALQCSMFGDAPGYSKEVDM